MYFKGRTPFPQRDDRTRSCYDCYMTDKPMPEDEEGWRKRLTPEQYRVLREKGTEAPFTGEHVHAEADGTFTCAACGNPLFSSDAKFDSGTGWPSFDEALPGAVESHADTSPAWCAPRSRARAAARISATCSTTARPRAASATASTRSVSISTTRARL